MGIPPEIKKPTGEASPPPPLPPEEAEAPKGKLEEKQKKAKKGGCPEATIPLDNGTCAPAQ